jgi:hypothetical protein
LDEEGGSKRSPLEQERWEKTVLLHAIDYGAEYLSFVDAGKGRGLSAILNSRTCEYGLEMGNILRKTTISL